jgi:hypothetical protein
MLHFSRLQQFRLPLPGFGRLRDRGYESLKRRVQAFCWYQAISFPLDDCVTLAAEVFQLVAIENRDPSTPIADDTKVLQFVRSLIDAFAANAKHVCDERLGHGQLVRLQSIQRQQQPSA